MASGFFRGAAAVIFVYDVTNADTFINVNHWIADYKQNSVEDAAKFLLGNKSDSYEKIVDFDLAKEFADAKDLTFLEVSAKDGTNIERAFQALLRQLVARKDNQIENRSRNSQENYEENSVQVDNRRQKSSTDCCIIL